jgi:cell division protein FtsQ
MLIRDVREIAGFVLNEEFWMSQVSQTDITADRNFEMIPLVGDHIGEVG